MKRLGEYEKELDRLEASPSQVSMNEDITYLHSIVTQLKSRKYLYPFKYVFKLINI